MLFGGIDIPGCPDLENVRRLDLLPIPFIRRAARIGMAIDPPYFHELTSKFSAERRELEKDIAACIPLEHLHQFSDAQTPDSDDFNAGSPEQIAKLLYDILGVGAEKKLKRTQSGRISTGKKQLEVVRLEHPVVPKILRHRELKTLID